MRRLLFVLAMSVAVLGLFAGAAFAAEVSITVEGFVPETVQVAPGETIVWTNDTPEDVSLSTVDGAWASGPLSPGQTFSVALSDPGSFPYVTVGGSLRGTVVVTDSMADPSASASTPAAPAAQTGSAPSIAETGVYSAELLVLALLLVAGGATLVVGGRRLLTPPSGSPKRRFRRVRRVPIQSPEQTPGGTE